MTGVYDSWYQTVDGKRIPSKGHGKGRRWQARWRDDARHQRKRSFDRKADAERQLAQVRADLARGAYLDPNAGKTTLRAYATAWLAAQTTDPSTREAVERHLRLHVLPSLGDYPLRSLRPSVVQEWLRGLELAAGTVRVTFTTFSAMLQAAVDDGMIARNPCRVASVRPPTPERHKVVPWPAEQVARVTAALPERYQALAVAAAGLGLRQGEALGLAVDDIDFLRRVVHVRRQVKQIGGRLVFAAPKGGKARDVPLAARLALRLAAHLRTFPAVAVALPWREVAGKPQTARLAFSTPEGGAINRNALNRVAWQPALQAAGVPHSRENGMHALRHHYATVLLEDGVNPRAVADWLGHADAGFTLRIYGHVMPSSEDRARGAIDRALGASSALDVPAGGQADASS
jgi:integrase